MADPDSTDGATEAPVETAPAPSFSELAQQQVAEAAGQSAVAEGFVIPEAQAGPAVEHAEGDAEQPSPT